MRKLQAVSVVLIILMSGCGALRPGIPGSGVSHSEYRNVAPFEQVDLSGFGTVNVHVGEAHSVCVTTDNNLLGHVETEVQNGKLRIRPRVPIRPRTGLNVDVTVPELSAAGVSGAGDLHVTNVMADQLNLSISGAGNLTADGYVNHLSTSISGAGDANLKHLFAENAKVRISGVGDARVFASESIDARVSGAGDVICYGQPVHVDQHVSGAGDFVLRTDDGSGRYTIGDSRQSDTPALR